MPEIHIKVEPGADEFKVEEGNIPKFYLKQEAENNKANTELLNKLEEFFDERPGIISGHRSRRKKLKISVPERKFRERLEEI